MKWEYRIVHRVVDGEDMFAIHEYYQDSITDEPVYPTAESVEDLLDQYTTMVTEAFHKPILEWEDF
jgi:hypothetical protein